MRTKLKILIIVIVVICASVVIGLLAGKTTNSNNKPSPVQPPKTVTNSNLIPTLKTKLESKYAFLASSVVDTSNTIGYPVAKDNFDVILPTNTSDSLSFEDKSTNDENTVYNALMSTSSFIGSYFKSNNYDLVGNDQNTSFLSDAIYYQNTKQVCQVTIYDLLDITCDSKSQVNNIAASSKPLVEVYLSQSSGEGQTTVSNPTIKSSQTSGYEVAIMNISNNSGQIKAYYYSLNNSIWQMVNPNWYNDPHEDGDVMPNCEDFESNPDVAKAFAGFSCYNSANRDTTTIRS